MKLLVQQQDLLKTLDVVGKSIINNPPLPILSSVLLNAKGTTLSISATDLYFGVTSSLKAVVEEPGVIAVLGKEFKQIIAGLDPGQVTLEKQQNSLSISSNGVKFELQIDTGEFPSFPPKPKQQHLLKTESLKRITQFVVSSASSDQTRPVLTCVLLSQIDNACYAIATDGFRLSRLEIDEVFAETGEILFPAKALIELYKTAGAEKVKTISLSISKEAKQVVASVAGFDFYIRLIEGEFPPYQKIIPQSNNLSVSIDAEELEKNLKRAAIFSEKTQSITQFVIKKGQLEMKAASPSLGSFYSLIEGVEIVGQENQIAFNTQYVLDVVRAVQESGNTSQAIKLEMSDPMKPAVFFSDNIKGFIYVVMPFRVN